MASIRKAVFISLLVWMATLTATGCAASNRTAANSLKAQSSAAEGRWPVLLAAYQAWFGLPGHMDVGYSSLDRVVLEKQVEEAKSMGIAGFVVNWYGPRKDFEDRSFAALQSIAGARDFKVALLYDEDENASQATEAAISDLNYAYTRYIGPTADFPPDAYLTYQSRPVIFIFPKAGHTDWNRVREAVDKWQNPPLLIYKDNNQKFSNAFDGYYAWVHPGQKGWSKDGSNWGQEYLDDFYKRMTTSGQGKIVVGAAWPGFDDTRASWSRNRKMDGRCGKTFDESLRVFRRYFDATRPLPFLMINTWNDYEEGTAIERGVDRCNGNRKALAVE
jgi:hypothetical protein